MPREVKSNGNQSLLGKSHRNQNELGPERMCTRGPWVGDLLHHCGNRNEAMAGAGFNVGSKQNLSGRQDGEEKQQAGESLTLGSCPGCNS